MNIKNISKAAKYSFWMLLFTIGSTCITYFCYKPILQNHVNVVKGTIKMQPQFGSDGGDMPRNYIKIELNEDNFEYFIMDCSSDVTNVNIIKKLKVGDSLELAIIAQFPGSKELKVYNLYSNKYGNILLLKDYNYCYTNGWKALYPFILIFGLALIYNLIKDNYFKDRKSES